MSERDIRPISSDREERIERYAGYPSRDLAVMLVELEDELERRDKRSGKKRQMARLVAMVQRGQALLDQDRAANAAKKANR